MLNNIILESGGETVHMQSQVVPFILCPNKVFVSFYAKSTVTIMVYLDILEEAGPNDMLFQQNGTSAFSHCIFGLGLKTSMDIDRHRQPRSPHHSLFFFR
jgi:hypothetical protein